MSAGPTANSAGGFRPAESRNRLSRIFAVLAILNIVTAVGALSMSQFTLTMLQEQQVDAGTWNQRVEELMSLRQVMAELDAPANAIFQSKDVARERRNLAAGEAQFGQALARVRDQFAPVVEGELSTTPLAKQIQAIDAVATEMAHRTHVVLDFYAAGRLEEAAQEMVNVDNAFVRGNEAITGYQVLTAADEHVCHIFGPLHGVFRDKASRTYQHPTMGWIAGPPFHVNCRCDEIEATSQTQSIALNSPWEYVGEPT